jgi:hypothetical protein
MTPKQKVLKKWPKAYAQIWPSTFSNGFSYVIVTASGAKELSAGMDTPRAAWADAAKRLKGKP